MIALTLTVRGANGVSRPLTVPVSDVALAGYTGRDRAKVMEHINELERAGVRPPDRVPAVFHVPAELAVVTASIVAGANTCGEAEFVLLASPEGRLVGVGSDHTDREIERSDVPRSKAACPKVIGPEVWRYEDVSEHWDSLELRSWSTLGGTKRLYQEGRLSDFIAADTLLAELADAGHPDRPGLLAFGGTLPLRNGGFEFGQRFDVELHDPVLKRTLSAGYEVRPS